MSFYSLWQRRAAQTPWDPWIFFREEDEWRWKSFLQCQEWLAGVREELAAVTQPDRVAYWDSWSWESMVVDLALEAEGLSAVPLPVSEAAGEERSVLLQTCRFRWAEEGLLEVQPAGQGEPEELAGSAGGGAHALVLLGGEPKRVSWTELEERGRELGRRLGEGPERDIVVRWRPLVEPGERVVFSWAVQSGAAVMMEPVAAYFPGTVRWARPTVVQGTTEDLARLATELGLDGGGRESRRLRKHLRRLRALICLGGEPELEKLSAWRSLDVEILHLS